jgi:hypothetical protein
MMNTTTAAARMQLRTRVVTAYRPDVARLVRRVVSNPKHRAEAEQVGAIGVLLALEKYDLTSGIPFGRLAMGVRSVRARALEGCMSAATLPTVIHADRRFPRTGPLHANRAEREVFVEAFAGTPSAFTRAQREAVQAVFVEGRSVRAAAAYLGVPHQTAQYRIRSARLVLRWLRRGGNAA